MTQPTVSCPTCQKPVLWNENSPYRPFCRQRCKMIDLGTWADESYRIPSQEEAPPQMGDHE